MAQVTFSASVGQAIGTPGGPDYLTTPVGTPSSALDAQATLLATAVTAVNLVDTDVDLAVTSATTADTNTGTVVTDIATAFTAMDVFGAALVAITGDTYSAVTHQWTTGGSTGLTHVQVVTLMALFNTMSTDFITGKTDTTTAKTATAAALVATTLVQTKSDLAVPAIAAVSLTGITVATGDAMISFDGTKVTNKNQVRIAGRALIEQAVASNKFT